MNVRLKRQAIWSLLFLLLFGSLSLSPATQLPTAQAADSGWPADKLRGLNMPFRPADGLVTTQNPPDFSWAHIAGASQYQLQVGRDASMAAPEFDVTLNVNYHNFPVTFEAGIWYWQVRYQTASGWSAWSTVREFRIAENAVPFPVPDLEGLIGQVEAGHPRIWTNAGDLEAFRALRLEGKSKQIFDTLEASVIANLNKNVPNEPTFPYMNNEVPTSSAQFVEAQRVLRNYSEAALGRMVDSAFAYLITGNEAYGADAKSRLLKIATWDPFGSTKYEIQDQVHRAIAYRSAIVYDWIYGLLSPTERLAVQNMIKTRTGTLIDKVLVQYAIPQNPYDSHGWTTMGYIAIISVAMMHDLPEADDWFARTVPAYINILPPWGGEDGSWSQGTGYWQWSSSANKELMDILLSAGVINLYDKAFSRNEGLYPLYMFPHGSPTGVFGNDAHYTPGAPSVAMLNRLAQMYQDVRLKWQAEAIGVPTTGLQEYFYGDADLASRPPMDLPKGKWFETTGYVAMHSELYDPDRTSLYFRSSPYGSYSHVQAEQNSFIIHAFGEPLAIKSGFYDFYDSPHHRGFAKQTFSANAITFDGRRGQPIENIDADGAVLGFATHPDFDAVTGDASVAYKADLTKAVRHILYLRPSMYVVIDDLATAKAGGSEFEWNLHTDDSLEFRPDNAGATVSKGGAAMNVQFHGSTAQHLRTTLETKFISASGTEVQPGGSFSSEKQIHAAFVTPKTNAVKLISTLEPYKRGNAPQAVASSETAEVLKLSFADGTNVYVRKTDSGTVDAGDGIRFDGSAVAVKGDSVLLVNGTKVERNGATIIASSAPSTIAYGDDQLSLTAQVDATMTLNAPGIAQVKIADTGAVIPNGGDVATAMNARGVHADIANGVLTLQVEKGQKALKLNDAPIPGPLAPVTLLTEVDGVPGQVTLQAHSDVDGVSVAWGQLSNVSGFYEVVEAPEGFLFERHGKIGSGLLEANARVILKGDTGVLKLRTIGADSSKSTVLYDVPNAERETRNMEWQEAENFVQWGNKAPSVYTTRPFLSGGKGMGDWNQVGQWVKWQMNVPRAGTYDVLLKYVGGWDLPAGQTQNVRYLQLGDQVSYFEAPKTFDFGTKEEYWKGLRVRTGQFLPAGQVEMTMWLQLGSMNLDWVALVEVKDDEIRPTAPTGLALDSRTEQAAVISWNGATDDVAVKEYAIFVDGVRKLAVPAGTHTATLTDLVPGKQYDVRVRTVDTSDNLSYEPPGATGIVISLADVTSPTWSAASTWTDLLLKDVARIAWAGATDVSGVKEYDVYRLDVSDTVPIATVSDSFYNATGLQPGGTYSFRIEARDPQGNTSVGGPTATVTTPPTSVGFFDSFDSWTVGDATNGNGWEYPTRTNGTAVKVVPIDGMGGNGLQAIDSFHSETDQYATTPRFYRTMAPIGGKVTIETRTKFSKINHEAGNYNIELVGGNRTIAMLVGLSDGGIGYQRIVNGKVEYPRLTESGFTQPVDEWITVRFDADFNTMTYDLIVQLDKLKSYSGVLDPKGTLDRETGVYRVEDIPFIEVTPFLKGVEMVRISSQRYTGKYTFDYLALYPTPEPDAAAPTTTDDAPESGFSKQDLVVSLTATDARSRVAYTKYSIDGGEPATGNSVALTTEGVHTITYWSVDSAGNVEAPRTVTVTLDKTAPVTSSDAPVAASSDVTVNLTATDNLSGAVLTQYAVNGGEPVDGTTVTLTEEGAHTIQYWSTDAAGNVEEPQSVTVTLDKTAPTTQASVDGLAGEAGWYRGPASVVLTATDASSGVSRTEYRLDNGDWTAAVGPIVVAADGVHQLEYRSVDAAGNTEASKSVELRIDATAPTLNVQLDRTSIFPPNKKMVDIRATLASNDATSGVATVTLTSIESNEPEEGSIEAAIGTSTDTFRVKADRNGNGIGRVYTVTYTVTDVAGNMSSAVATVTVPHHN
ncbi:MAG TPA: DUF4962 domain-containing protein [Paenibacillus sp.]|nr:DUF4962 domain-containing protein [Paenibacillus sp.]